MSAVRTVLVTGSEGFLGQNLCLRIEAAGLGALERCDLGTPPESLSRALERADVVVHLAGVNRPPSNDEFRAGNVDFTASLCETLLRIGRSPKILFSSSIQAELDNPYGRSKREAEEVLERYALRAGARVVVYRLKNLFGKWCRPNYNSVVATFCHNLANGLPIEISDPKHTVELTHVDDAVMALLREITSDTEPSGFWFAPALPARRINLGELADKIRSFSAQASAPVLPDLSDPFVKALHSTYLTYAPAQRLAHSLNLRSDTRGSLAEFLKQPSMGQIFLSRTRPGITRGNHYHHTKVEKFLVVQGEAVVRLRDVRGGQVVEYSVRGEEFTVVDIPAGYTHSIENVGKGDLVTIFWSNEVFDPDRPDTLALPVFPMGVA